MVDIDVPDEYICKHETSVAGVDGRATDIADDGPTPVNPVVGQGWQERP